MYPSTKLKYRLKELFVAIYGSEKGIAGAKIKLSSLPYNQRVALGTIKSDVNILMYESAVIPDERLDRYAKFFGIYPDYIKADYLAYIHTQKQAA